MGRLWRVGTKPGTIIAAERCFSEIQNPNGVSSGCLLIAPEHEYNHFLMEQVVLMYDEQAGTSRGVILERPTAFTMDEMVPGFDEFDSNLMFTGGEDGGKSVVMIHAEGDLEGARPIGSGLFVGGVAAAREAIARGANQATDFKFFFNHVAWTDRDIEGMLDGGGWRAVRVPEESLADIALQNAETGLWNALSRSLDKGRTSF